MENPLALTHMYLVLTDFVGITSFINFGKMTSLLIIFVRTQVSPVQSSHTVWREWTVGISHLSEYFFPVIFSVLIILKQEVKRSIPNYVYCSMVINELF